MFRKEKFAAKEIKVSYQNYIFAVIYIFLF
jgi:hypothetical protein